ncbi:MAG: hypothetical protein QM785_17995 [Pyrinomonadaceae bacterium]
MPEYITADRICPNIFFMFEGTETLTEAVLRSRRRHENDRIRNISRDQPTKKADADPNDPQTSGEKFERKDYQSQISPSVNFLT